MVRNPVRQKPMFQCAADSQEIMKGKKNCVSTICGLQIIILSIKKVVTEPPSGWWA